ncbi:hypothetical protein [Nocardioides yefusunii]|uniref:Insertion element protein n=1 Tax=Nocardioides yefusunii TaxID=2500546 RepID=A0ABW1QUJ4_9ACTN|nr:hypothetical protein [Nocardioides yefusunii]
MSGRAQPNHCPYCGDDNLWPHLPAEDAEAPGASWECRSCLRKFDVKYHGMIARPGGNR